MGIYIHPKLIKGFQNLQETNLSDDEVWFLSIIADHRLSPDKAKELFLNSGKTLLDFWAAVRKGEKFGYLMWHDIFQDGKTRTDKYEVHPELKGHLMTKYGHLFRDSRTPETVFSIGLSHVSNYSFQISFIANQNIVFEKGQRYSAHLDIKWKRATLEIKKLT